MDPHFLRDVETAHRLECQDYWGPSFASGVRALVALGELLLVANNEHELAAIEIEPTSTRLGSSTLTVTEALEKCSREYSDTFHRSEVSLDKLSSRAKELSKGLGPVRLISPTPLKPIASTWRCIGS